MEQMLIGMCVNPKPTTISLGPGHCFPGPVATSEYPGGRAFMRGHPCSQVVPALCMVCVRARKGQYAATPALLECHSSSAFVVDRYKAKDKADAKVDLRTDGTAPR